MKKAAISIIMIPLILLMQMCVGVVKADSTSYTVTLTINETEEVSQDAYIPSAMYLDLNLNDPQDLYIGNGNMYIADTGNSRILVVDLSTNQANIIGADILKSPKGVSADADGRIYVADTGTKLAYRFDATGELEFTFEKPNTPNFGEDEKYSPAKISPSENGGAYIISDGTQAGVVHLSGSGDFLGYFASNEVKKTGFDALLSVILTEAQKAQLATVTPPSFQNIFKGEDGLVYTVNKGVTSTIKKHSINGVDMLKSNKNMPKLDSIADICVSSDGRIIALDASGYVVEISFDGYLLCKFAGPAKDSSKIGLFGVPKGVGMDAGGNIYVLDSGKRYVQVFSPTYVQKQIQSSIALYNEGNYDDSIEILTDVMKYNNSSYFAHLYLGLNYMQKTEYTKASEHFKTANAKEQYSEAFWEYRNQWLQENMSYIIIGVVALAAVLIALHILNKRKGIFNKLKAFHLRQKKRKLYFDITQIKHGLFHPIDNAYEIRKGHTGSYLMASVIYLAVFGLVVLMQIGSGFMFSVSVNDFSIANTTIIFFGVMGLFLIANFFISSINDGEGTFKSMFVSVAYSLSPALITLPLITLFSNFATLDETYVIATVLGVTVALCFVNIFLTIIEVQQYSFKQTIANLLLTVFLMIVMIFAGSIVYLLIKQIYDFAKEILVEVSLRG